MNETTKASGTTPAFAGRHEPRPLPFDPAKLTAMSERLIRSHWENNYCSRFSRRCAAPASTSWRSIST